MKFEDGWWQGTLLFTGENDLLPPAVLESGGPANAVDLPVGTTAVGLDKQEWHVVLGSDGSTHTWARQSGRAWPSRLPGEEGCVYVIATTPAEHIHVVGASELRACNIWNWRHRSWTVATSLAALSIYSDVRTAEERRLLTELKKAGQKGTVDAQKPAQLELSDDRNKGNDEETEARKRARFEEGGTRRAAKAADEDQHKRQRAELEEERKSSTQLARSLAGQREKFAAAAGKFGFHPGMQVEAPLLGLDAYEYVADSLYEGKVAFFGKAEALVAFPVVDGMPQDVADQAHESMIRRAVHRRKAGDVAEETAETIASVLGAEYEKWQYFVCWISLAELRPVAPPLPDSFGPPFINLSAPYEIRHRGGWYKVKVTQIHGSSSDFLKTSVDGSRIEDGARVRVRKTGSDYFGHAGVVDGLGPGGRYKVNFDRHDLEPRHFRAGELELEERAAPSIPGGHGEQDYPYLVRFISAQADDKRAAIGVNLADIRPGWSWKAGKWVGVWQPKVKSKRVLEREAAFERLKIMWPIGMRIECLQDDDGMQGSWYDCLAPMYSSLIVRVTCVNVFVSDLRLCLERTYAGMRARSSATNSITSVLSDT